MTLEERIIQARNENDKELVNWLKELRAYKLKEFITRDILDYQHKWKKCKFHKDFVIVGTEFRDKYNLTDEEATCILTRQKGYITLITKIKNKVIKDSEIR